MATGIRASDAERERAVDLIKAAFIAGLLTRDELAERVGAALTARTHADLATVTAGIPADTGIRAPRAPAPARARRRRRPGAPVKAFACLVAATALMLTDAAFTGARAGSEANGFYFLCIMAFAASFIVWLCTIVAARARESGTGAGQPPRPPGSGRARGRQAGSKTAENR